MSIAREAGIRLGGWLLLVLGAGLLLAGSASAAGPAITPEKIQDFIWRSVNFLVFAAILIKLLAKPAKGFFAQRAKDIAQSFEDLEEKKAQAEAALKEAEGKLAQVAQERERILQLFVAEGEAEKARIVGKAEQVAARIQQMAEITIKQETKKAVQELRQEVVEMAARLSEDLLTKKITPKDHQRLVEEYLDKVVESH